MERTRTDVFRIGRHTQSAGNDARRPCFKVNNFIRNISVLCSLLDVLIVDILCVHSRSRTHSFAQRRNWLAEDLSILADRSKPQMNAYGRNDIVRVVYMCVCVLQF